MGRPSSPLISRGSVVAAALSIIDQDGPEGLSLPRLAKKLDVKAPSLYHHFADKEDILAEVARTIIAQTIYPPSPSADRWVAWQLEVCLNMRDAVLRHRRAAPILLRHLPRDLLVDFYEQCARFLTHYGIADELHVLILDGLEKVSLGAAIAEAVQESSDLPVTFARADPDRHPVLMAANVANTYGARAIFEHTVRAYLLGVTQFEIPATQDPEIRRRIDQIISPTNTESLLP